MPRCKASAPVIAPPISGEITMGTRFSMDSIVKPIARRSAGSASPIVANIAGDPIDCHAITKASPAKKYGQAELDR